jgi:Tfp pilus assembly protein PilN
MAHHINLLPWEFRRKTIQRRLLQRWAAVTALLAVSCGMMLGVIHQSLRQSRIELARLHEQAAPLRRAVSESHHLTALLQRSGERRLLLDSLNATDQPLQLLGIISRSAAETPGEIVVQGFEITESEVPAPSGQTSSGDRSVSTLITPAPTRRLGLSGMATDDLALSRFIAELRDSGVFRAVELRASNDIHLNAGSARHYVVECSF